MRKEMQIHEVENVYGLGKVDDNIPIARYYSREKLEKLLEERSLWFSNAEKFSDSKERTIPEGFYSERFKPSQKEEYQKIADSRKKYIKAYISCWTKFDSENYALWKIYDTKSSGACLVTTVGKLRAELEKNRKDIITTEVEYVDLNNGSQLCDLPWVVYKNFVPPIRMTENFKQKVYSYEQEIRFIVS